MATTAYALKQLEKAGAKVFPDPRVKRRYVGQMPAARIEVTDQDGEAISIYVIKNGVQDEIETDYFGGHFIENIKHAIEFARKMENWQLPPERKPETKPVDRFAGWYEELS